MGIPKIICMKIKALNTAGYSVADMAKAFGIKEGIIRSIVESK